MKILRTIIPLTVAFSLSLTTASALPVTHNSSSDEPEPTTVSFEQAFGLSPDEIIEVEPGEEFSLGEAVKYEEKTGRAGLTGSIVVATVTCTGSYDYPHPSTYSSKQTINAHLVVICKGTGGYERKTTLRIQTRMTDGTRLGLVNTENSLYGSARKGGDLKCTYSPAAYRAIGTAAITFPVGFTPAYGNFGIKSAVKSFKHNGKECAAY
ncbi:hypothetical protein [Timonella senegalensis]|uniref:hypothetical protein n=1 Tax=Timonella senegalensis TaxID=1465825 RepID=UPI0012B66DFA|nr:hypothetical protein [Timonella senegalensis]